MQCHQFVSIALVVAYLMNVLILRATDVALIQLAVTDGPDIAVFQQLKCGLHSRALDHPQSTGRLSVIVDQAFLTIFPANTKQFVPGSLANQIAAVGTLVESQKSPQVVLRNGQLRQVRSQALDRHPLLQSIQEIDQRHQGLGNSNGAHDFVSLRVIGMESFFPDYVCISAENQSTVRDHLSQTSI